MSNASQAAIAVSQANLGDAEELRVLFEMAKSLIEDGQAQQALPPLRDILSRSPNHPDALNFVSVAFGKLGMLDEAVSFSRQAVAQRPHDAGFHLNLANRLKEQGRIAEALESYRRALAINPQYLPALKSQLQCLIAEQRWSDAKEVVEEMAAAVPGDAELLAECGATCISAEDLPRAQHFYERALAIAPDRLPWLLQLARLAINQDKFELAKTTGEHVLRLENHPEMRAMLASIMHRNNDLKTMAEHLDAIPEGTNQAGNAANLRGMMLASQVRIREALDEMARTNEFEPNSFTLQATRVMYLNYDPDMSVEAVRDAHFEVGQRFAHTLPLLDQQDLGLPHDPERRLRIGFTSPDLRAHSVAYFAQPYFNAFDRERFEVFAYAYVPNEDMVSDGLREQVTCWRNIFHLGDQALAQQIRDDRIDILVDLAGYTRDTSLKAFTARPAPIQMTYIGYPNTTGMPAVDYRVVDGITDPEGADQHYSEDLIRLPGCFLCYAVPNHAPPVEPGPAEHRGWVTFGCFNNFAKINPSVLATWADVLHAVPRSRLLCKSVSSDDPTTQNTIREVFESCGVDPKRVSFCAYRKTPESHLAVYNDVDIALDTFPYNGTTTTCESLWMGVPVVTLCGDRHASRVGASLLSAIGFPAGIAESRDEYVLTARLLAENPRLLKTIRRTLRDDVMNSALCDSNGHAAKLEHMFRSVWRKWCEQQSS